eukprot:12571551-Alexandrium_andersonii.AAC.1
MFPRRRSRLECQQRQGCGLQEAKLARPGRGQGAPAAMAVVCAGQARSVALAHPTAWPANRATPLLATSGRLADPANPH